MIVKILLHYYYSITLTDLCVLLIFTATFRIAAFSVHHQDRFLISWFKFYYIASFIKIVTSIPILKNPGRFLNNYFYLYGNGTF